MSRARLGLYVFARVSLFQNCFELTPAFNQLTARPPQLHIRPHEYFNQEQPREASKKPDHAVKDMPEMANLVYTMYMRMMQQQQRQQQQRMAGCGSCIWAVMWLVILLCFGWPISIALGGLYGLISPLTTCVGLDRLSDLLLEGANVGRKCAQNMRHCKPLC
ncbi:hypothetical protein NHX12_019902 [Muraenolepis orangiensis]|uniref:Uncharacterized protein n=1 Tax=Muraenolepis orangiensis TaxID=630683 RepID=A0A9Q0EUF6_9TELE|nr:hypothetical protein NHX12_019902 [Muraenolepis orangiensis]